MSYTFNPLDSIEMTKNDVPSHRDKTSLPDEFGYEFVKFGEPSAQAMVHEKCTEDIATLIEHYFNHGYSDRIPRLTNLDFKRHVAKFRATLDAWELIPISKVFSKEEIYVRCLQEGPQFTEFIKKSRATTLRGLTTLTETDLEEEYFHPEGYSGYDSIIHERNLIHWDDREGVDDVKYSFMPAHGRTYDFKEIFERFLRSLRIDQFEFDLQLDSLGELKNTKMYDPVTRKTSLMREFWTETIPLSEPYLAKRTVVLVEPGSTRDTGVGDPGTIAKVKAVTRLCRTILERCTHSASAPAQTSSARMIRVLERNTYLHLDFKKYGLAFPRALQNIALEIIGSVYAIDMEDLLIHDFFIDIDGEIFQTCRGTTLGWFDCLNELCVHAILWNLSYEEGLKFDWIAFNDDVEISFYSSENTQAEKAEMVRDVVLSKFNLFDILLSISKTYASKASLFLEKYFRFEDEYGFNMEKRQLSSKMYGRALVSREPWRSKIYFASAYSVWPSEELSSRCILTTKIEFDETERVTSLFCGGWYPNTSSDLDRSCEETSDQYLRLAVELQSIDIPDISTKPEKVSSQEKITLEKVRTIPYHKDSEDGRDKFTMTDVIYDVNFEITGMADTFRFRSGSYSGRNVDFALTYERLMSAIVDQNAAYDPGGN